MSHMSDSVDLWLIGSLRQVYVVTEGSGHTCTVSARAVTPSGNTTTVCPSAKTPVSQMVSNVEKCAEFNVFSTYQLC